MPRPPTPTLFPYTTLFRSRRLGVVALQLPVDRINAVMTGDRKWETQGLGRTGETYLIGPDRRMRSDSRFFLTAPQRRSEEHTSELQSHHDLVCRLLLEKKK